MQQEREVTCPKCHKKLKFAQDKKIGFCKYCGEAIKLIDEIKDYTANNNNENKLNKNHIEENKKTSESGNVAAVIIFIFLGLMTWMIGSSSDNSSYTPSSKRKTVNINGVEFDYQKMKEIDDRLKENERRQRLGL